MGDVQPFNSLTSGTNAMQLKKLSPLAGLLLTALLGACGGGGGDEPPPPAAPPPPAVSVSAVSLSSTSPPAYAENYLKFDGGECSGGTGALTVSWNFGDGTALDSSTTSPHTHKYDETTAGNKTVTVTCTDSAGKTSSLSTAFDVQSAAMNGFLGKKWTAYSNIETNVSPYPVAGIADSGDVYGAWLRRVGTVKGVAISTTNFSSSSWASPTAFPTVSDTSAFDDTTGGMRTAAIDLAVSRNGKAIAAWITAEPTTPPAVPVFTIRYTTKSGANSAWTAPAKISVTGVVLNESIKVVINDAGVSAIAYCTGTVDALGAKLTTTGAEIITNLTAPAPISISKLCDKVVDDGSFGTKFQRNRAFDIAINNKPTPTIYAVGVNAAPAPNATNKLVVTEQSYTNSAWTTPIAISDELELARAPHSLSYSLSSNGDNRAVAWDQLNNDIHGKSNVYARIYFNNVWRAVQAVQDDYTTKDYSLPLIAINDRGDAFLAMQLNNGSLFTYKTEVSNYDATATAWSRPFQTSNLNNSADTKFNSTDVAIDQYGTGLVTYFDGYKSAAGTFAKKVSSTQWRGFATISPSYPYQKFHYQTMRALPDGRAILVTSVYDDITARTGTTTPVMSGYTTLK